MKNGGKKKSQTDLDRGVCLPGVSRGNTLDYSHTGR